MLETEIKRLSENISQLSALIEAMLNGQKDSPAGEIKPDPVPTAEKPKKKSVSELVDEHCEKVKEEVATKSDTPDVTNEAYTTDDIKSMALAISRKDRSKQKDIKAKLAEHDAKVANDLKGDGLQIVGEWLSALKEELSA